MGNVAGALAGKHVLLTGVTGFVGEALLRLMLAEVPDVRLTLLIRPRGSTSGADRARTLLGKDTFTALGHDIDALLAGRIDVLEGDLSDVPALPTDLDAVVHCAGDVSFDPPVDEGFRTNVVGTRDLLDRVREAGDDIHYVHISTAYVAGRRRGTIPEDRVDHAVDVDAELAWGLAQRTIVENQSRSTAVLEKLRSRSERQHGRAGLLTAAAAAEERRKEWVKEHLVRIGTERARSLGWTDCYTFTKALGERVVEAHARTARVSIVRPSIIESALEKPYPGWIEGFKMAEPLILAYGRGELPEFPAAGDTIVDIVPVDHVVAAIVAVLAHPPEPGAPAYFHASSGARNPLTIRALHASVRVYFDEHPFEMDDRGAVRLPDWRFPGAQSVERLLASSEKAHQVANYVIGHAPRGDRTRDLARKLDQQGRRLEFLRRYLNLYREYAEAELRFDDAHTIGLYRSLDEADRASFAFDTAVVDWDHYLREVHCPAVTEPIRKLDKVRRARRKAPAAGLKTLVPTSSNGDGDGAGGGKVAAFFDMDGTLLSSNVIETYLWMRLQDLSTAERASEIGRIAARLPGLVRAERRERSAFLRSIYREYEGARLERPRPGGRRVPHRPRAGPARPGRHPPGPRAPRRRPPDGADHRRDPAADPPAGAALRPRRGGRAGSRRHRPVHRVPGVVPARGRVPLRVDAAVGVRQRHRPRHVVRLRRQLLRPAAARGRRQPGRRPARRRALPARPQAALEHRRLAELAGHRPHAEPGR